MLDPKTLQRNCGGNEDIPEDEPSAPPPPEDGSPALATSRPIPEDIDVTLFDEPVEYKESEQDYNVTNLNGMERFQKP